MRVRVGSSLSDYYDKEQGVPQGGVLSTTLFSIKINDIVNGLVILMIAYYNYVDFSVSVIAQKARGRLHTGQCKCTSCCYT